MREAQILMALATTAPARIRAARTFSPTPERFATCIAGAAVTAVPQVAPHIAFDGALAGLAGLAAWAAWRSADSIHRVVPAAMRALSPVSLAAMEIAARLSPGMPVWEIAGPVVLTGLLTWSAPYTQARATSARLAPPPPDPPALEPSPEPEAEPEPLPDDPFAALIVTLWRRSPASKGTRLERIYQHSADRADFSAVIVATEPGSPVPAAAASPVGIAAALDVPAEWRIVVTPATGRGPGYLDLTVTEPVADGQSDIRTLWRDRVATGIFPGARITRYRPEDNGYALVVEAAPGQTLGLTAAKQKQLCAALEVVDESLMMVTPIGPAGAVIRVFDRSPFLEVRTPTADDLTMEDGWATIGVRVDGTPARIQLINDHGRIQPVVISGVSGSGKSVAGALLAAIERQSGIVSWVADVQGGMSLPSLPGRVDRFFAGREETLIALRALKAVCTRREELCRGQAALDPAQMPYLCLTIDEPNRLLADGSEEAEDAALLLLDLLRTGQKVGVSVRMLLQGVVAKSLGNNRDLRSALVAGNAVAMRNSSMGDMEKSLEGHVPEGMYLTPIAQGYGAAPTADEILSGAPSRRSSSAGEAWMGTGGELVRMRTLRCDRSTSGGYPELEALMDACPMRHLDAGSEAAAEDCLAPTGAGRVVPDPAPAGEENPDGDDLWQDVIDILTKHPGATGATIREHLGGASTKTVAAALTALRKDGVITSDGGRYTLTD